MPRHPLLISAGLAGQVLQQLQPSHTSVENVEKSFGCLWEMLDIEDLPTTATDGSSDLDENMIWVKRTYAIVFIQVLDQDAVMSNQASPGLTKKIPAKPLDSPILQTHQIY